jgi:eukaryotic-like serine/threonine-protein kinase
VNPGTRLGSYEIIAPIGAGGMGEVYRAHDSKLERDVAIKVLPAAFVEDHERLQRFEREAKLLAQLNHPNIAHIYGMEASGESHALVMELVEGEGLDELMARGPVLLDEALPIARQVADALEAAHEHGIVHRDLKPANVRIRPDGTVKVLDFGLAKTWEGGGEAGLTHSPTITQAHTAAGVILGTAAYMSPEQARGKAVDKRADIWALGVVLYEMLTGVRLFEGETVTDVLANVLKHEADWGFLPAGTPPEIRRLLRRCLERDPKNRLHDIADARLVINDALLSGGEAAAVESQVTSKPNAAPLRRLAPWALLLVAVSALAGWLAHRGGSSTAPAVSRLSLRRLTDLPGLESSPDISPDGKQLVYSSSASGNRDIYITRIDGGRAIDITPNSPSDDEQPAFSPDGQQIAFRSSRDGGGLFVMGATGESVRRLTDVGFDPAWSPDGKRIAYSMEAVVDPYSRNGDAALWIVDITTGEKRKLPPQDAVQPAWSPDGKRIAYWANSAGQRDLWTVGVDGGEPVAVTRDAPTDWSPEWSPDGRWLYFSSDRAGGMNLFRVPIDPTTGGAAGAPEAVTTSAGNLGWVRISADGKRMVAAAYELNVVLAVFHLTSGSAPTLQPVRTIRPRTVHWCLISPDADWFACSTIGTPEDLVLLRADGSELRRLTDDGYKDRNARWSLDGSRLLFQSTRSGGWCLWSLRTDGSELRQVSDGSAHPNDWVWRSDGKRATAVVPGRGVVDLDLDRLTALADAKATPLPASMKGFVPGAWSPDGKLLGGTEVDDTVRTLSIGALDPERGVYLRSRLPVNGYGFNRFAGWLPDSRHYVALGADQIALVDAVTGEYRTLLPVAYVKDMTISLSDDGATLLLETPTSDGDVWLLESTPLRKAGK